MIRCLGCMAEYDAQYGTCPYCGCEPRIADEYSFLLQPGTTLNEKYLIGKAIASGGVSCTYVAWDKALQQRVVAKEYLPIGLVDRPVGQAKVKVVSDERVTQFSAGLMGFLDEARRLVQLQNTPGIVRIYDSFRANNTAYIVMGYLEGETLATLLEREGKISIDCAIEMLTPVFKALDAIHTTGFIHLNVTPYNILFTRTGQTKLIGLVPTRYGTSISNKSTSGIITSGFSPLEQYECCGNLGPYTDVYALSAVLYRMVTGIIPPEATDRLACIEGGKMDPLGLPSRYCRIDRNKEIAILNAMTVKVRHHTKTATAFLDELTKKPNARHRMWHPILR